MKRKPGNNIALMVISLLLAILLWLAVINTTDPMIVKTITGLPIAVENAQVMTDSGKTFSIAATGTVQVNVRQNQWDTVKGSDFQLYVDMKEWYPDTGTVPVHMRILDTAIRDTNVTLRTNVVSVDTDNLESVTVAVEIDRKGKLQEGYMVVSQSTDPPSVNVEGPAGVLARIGRAAVAVDVTEMVGQVTAKGDIQLFDKNGDEIDLAARQLKVSRAEAQVSMQILRSSTVPLVLGEVPGTPAEGYVFSESSISPQTVEIYGLKSVLGSISSITVLPEDLTVDGLTESKEVTVSIDDYLPDGVSIGADADKNVTIRLTIEPLHTKLITFTLEEIAIAGIDPALIYEYDRDELPAILLRGLEEDLDHVTAASLAPRADLSGLGPGIHEIPLTLTLDPVYEVVSSSPLSVIVREDVPEETETEPETEPEQPGESESESAPEETGEDPAETEAN